MCNRSILPNFPIGGRCVPTLMVGVVNRGFRSNPIGKCLIEGLNDTHMDQGLVLGRFAPVYVAR
jgi:hypothetical protein